MTRKEAVMIAGRVLACYPSTPRDDATLAAFTEEILERFANEAPGDVMTLALAFCREQEDRYCPSAFELVGDVAKRLRRARTSGLRLVEPALTPEEVAANKARLRAIIEGVHPHVRGEHS